MVSVYPARRRTSTLGVVPVGLGDGVGDCHDVASFLEKCIFISLFYLFGRTNFSLFSGVSFLFFITAGYAGS